MPDPKTFSNIGWLEVDTPPMFRDWIEREVKNPGDDYRHNLAGHTSGAYLLAGLSSDKNYERWLLELADAYDEAFPAYRETICHNRNVHDLRLDEVWVNHHSRHDFNPMHWHGGVFSFVTWVSVPYTREQEAERFKANNPLAGQFCFTVTDVLGEIHDQVVEQKEWTTLFFPARMRHKVHPYFSTDKMRVSISGNLVLV